MNKTIKIEIKLNKAQINKCNIQFGILRYLYNEFITMNVKLYNDTKKFIFGYEFDKYINNILSKDKPWIKDCSSKARKDMIMIADKTLRKFFKDKTRFLKYKSKKDPVQSFFFIKDNIKWLDDSHISIPILKKIKLREKNYLQKHHLAFITSGRIVKECERYYVCLYVKDCLIRETRLPTKESEPLGIDVGIKTYATIFNGTNIVKIPHINDINKNIKFYEDKIIQLQKIISYKSEVNKRKLGYIKDSKIRREDTATVYNSKNIIKYRKRINTYKKRLRHIRVDFIKKLCNYLVRTKPKYITIEDLSTQHLLKVSTHKLADKLQKSLFYFFRVFLTQKCREYDIELRIADKYFASSKLCSCCGHKKKSLKLSNRVYICEKCDTTLDRDDNAAINLFHTEKYSLAC